MPTYDYICKECGHAFEEFQSMSDDPLQECPACGRPTLQRRIGSGAGLLFKGSGFYLTDYKKSGSSTSAASSSKGSGQPSSSKGDGDSSPSNT